MVITTGSIILFNDTNHDGDYNSSEYVATYSSLAAAVAAAQDGQSLYLQNGTYAISSTLVINKSISIYGQSEAGVTIDASSVSNTGIWATADGFHMEKLTINGPAAGNGGTYGLKVGPDSGVASDTTNNVKLSHITVQGSGRSEFDINGVNGGTFDHLTANGFNTAGVGIAVTHSANLTFDGVTTSGNNWGAIGIYDGGPFSLATSSIAFTNTTHGSGETVIYSDSANGNTLLDQVSYSGGQTWVVYTNGYSVGFAGANAQSDALALASTDPNSAVEAPSGAFVVNAGMSLQAAVNAANAGDTIQVGAGAFDLSTALNITKSLTISGTNAGTSGTVTRGSETVLTGGTGVMLNLADSAITVTLDGVKLVGDQLLGEGAGQTLTIANSVLDFDSTHGVVMYLGYAGGNTLHFTNNSVELSGSTDFMELFESGTIDISGNHFTGVEDAAAGNDQPVFINLNGVHGTISGNTFTNFDNGVVVGGTTHDLSVTGNTFENAHRDNPATDGYAGGIVLVTPQFTGPITISDNQFTDVDAGIRTSTYPGARALGGLPITIDDNDFDHVTAPLFVHTEFTGALTATDSTVDDAVVPTLTVDGHGAAYQGTTGDDAFAGGSAIEAMVYDEVITTGELSYDSATNTWKVHTQHNGTDTLVHFDKVTGSDGHSILLVDTQGSFTSIQAAVNAAADGDTILVAAGTYVEQVLIAGRTLHIVGYDGAKLQLPDNAAVQSSGGYNAGITVIGGNVTIDNLDVDGRNQGNGFDGQTFAAIAFKDADGAYTNGAITGFEDSALSGAQHGYGIIARSTDSGTHTVEVAHATIGDFQKNGIDARGPGLVVNLHDNTITGEGATGTIAQNGIVLVNGAAGTITNNAISDLSYTGADTATGLLLFSAGATTASGNTFTDTETGIGQVGTFALALANPGGNTFVGNGTNFLFDPEDAGTTGFSVGGTGGNDVLDGTAGADTFTGGAGADSIDGKGGLDTAAYAGTLTSASFTYTGGHWHVAGDTLENVEVVTDTDGHTFRLVGTDGSDGYTHVQDAVNVATAGDYILMAPGTYTESGTDALGRTGGLYINTAGLRLQGYSAANGGAITTATDARDNGPTIISGAQNNFGANHWVDQGGTGVSITGLHLQAGPDTTDNKLLEIWADHTSVTANFIDVYAGGTYTGAVAVYLNDNGTDSDWISAYAIGGNILNEGIYIANGTGNPGNAADQTITGNTFTGDRYDTIAFGGKVTGVGYLNQSVTFPTVTGNTFEGDATPFLLRGTDDNAAALPNRAAVEAFLASNTDAATHFAYVLDANGDLRLAQNGAVSRFAVTNTIDTLNLALDATADDVFGTTPRQYIHAGDTVVVQTGADAVDSQIMVENLHVRATANSADLDLTLATQFADNSPIANGGVHNVTLDDYDTTNHLGANVDVTGNALDNVITGNSGNNVLDGGDGNDTLVGGGGDDTITGGAGGRDVAVFAAGTDLSQLTASGGAVSGIVTGPDGTDTVSGVEVIQVGTTFYVLAGMSIQAAIDAAPDGATIVVAGGTYTEQLSIDHRSGLTIEAASGATVVVKAPASLAVSGHSDYYDGYPGENVRAVIGVTDSTGITITGIDVDGAFSGDTTSGSNGDEITGVAFIRSSGSLDDAAISHVSNSQGGGLFGLQHGSGVFIDGTAAAGLAVSVTDSTISDFQKTGVLAFGVDLTFTGNTIIGIGATGLIAQNGIQVAHLSGDVSGNTIEDIGYTVPAGGVSYYSAGIIAYEPSGPLSIDDNHLTGVGTAGDFAGIDVSDTGGVNIAITNNDFADATYGIYAYTYVGGAVGLDDVTISGNDFTNISVEGVHFAPEEVASGGSFSTPNGFTVGGTAFDDTLAGSAGADTFDGLGGRDTLQGNGGNDTLIGGLGTDTAVYSGAASGYTFTGHVGTDGRVDSFTGVTDTDASNGGDGADTLSGVERLSFNGGATVYDVSDRVQLFDAGGVIVGTYNTIQAAIDAAADDYTIRAAAGTYAENLNVNKAVMIEGANAGIAGTGMRGLETIINGQTTVSAAATINGVEVLNGSDNSTQFIGVRVTGSGDVTVENSVFYSAGVNGAAEDKAINLDTTTSGSITFADNYVTGAATGKYGSSASWHRGVWSDGANAHLTVTGNTFEYVRSAMNLDGFNDSNVTVSGNHFTSDGTGIALGEVSNSTAITGIHDNVFTSVDNDLNLRNLTDGVSFDLGATHNVGGGTGAAATMYVFGTAGADALTGTAGDDILDARAAEDGLTDTAANSLNGAAGNDTLIGSLGEDTLTGGAGNDTLLGGGGDDTAVVTGTYTVTAASGGWTVTSTDGTDTLSDVEIVSNGTARTLLVGNGGYATLADAMADAADGDTILLAAGSYAGDATVDKDVTIVGANHGIAGTAHTGPESVLTGTILVTASGVTFDGVEFTGQGHAGGSAYEGAVVTFGNGLTVTNSVFAGTPSASGTSAGIEGGGTGIDVGNSLFSGYDVGIYVSGGGSTGSIHGNTFQGVDGSTQTGMGNGVNTETTGVTISNNVFDGLYAGSINTFPFGITSVDLDTYILTNTFSHTVDRPIQFFPVDGTTTIDGTAYNEAFRLDEGTLTAGVSVNAQGGNDAIYGSNFGDTLEGGTGNDRIDGNGGNDTIYAGDGNDTIDGGDGTDTLVLRGGFSGYSVTHNTDGSYTITDTNTADGNDGTDTVSGVETVRLGGVNGQNYNLADLPDDAPVANDDTNAGDALKEDVDSVAVGNVLTNDTNTDAQFGDTLRVTSITGWGTAVVPANGSAMVNSDYGILTIHSDGSYSFALDGGYTSVNSLAEGQTVTYTFHYTVTDNAGHTDTADLTLTIVGTNDAPVIYPVNNTGSVRESGNFDNGSVDAGTPSASDTFVSGDPDTGDTRTFSGGGSGIYGTFAITSGGTWTYTLDNSRTATQALAERQSTSDSYTFTVTDNHGATATQTVTVAITGTNDAPKVTPATATATEDGATVTGSVAGNASDVDAGATRSFALANGAPSWIMLATDGSYSINTHDAAFQSLAGGEPGTFTANYTVKDDKDAVTPGTLTLTVTGTNDAPVLSAVSGTPVDLTETAGNTNTNFAAQNGTLTVNDVDHADAVTGTILGYTVTFNGQAPSGATQTAIANALTHGEGGNGSALTFGSATPNGTAAALSWSYDPGSANLKTLSEEDVVTITYTVKATDGDDSSADTKQIVINVHGFNDVYMGTPDDDTITASGNADDIYGLDGDDSINAGGGNDDVYGGAGDDSILGGGGDDLIYGEDGDDVIDGGSNNDTIYGGAGDDSINGGSGDDRIYVGDGNATVNGGSGTDTLVLDHAWTDYTITRAGSNTYMIEGPEGEISASFIENFVFAGNAPGQTGPFPAAQILNDAPVGMNDTAASGNVLTNDTDPDSTLGDTKAVSGVRAGTEAAGGALTSVSGVTTVTGKYGTLTINPNGTYSYAVDASDPDTLALGNGSSATEAFTYQVKDAHGLTDLAQISITVTGSNTPPTGPATGSLANGTEDVTRVITASELLAGFTDANNDTLSVQNLAASRGTLVDNGNGTYNLSLPANDNGAVTLTYEVSDGHGGTANATRGVTFTPVNDAPTASPDSYTVAEDGTLNGSSVLANDNDIDSASLSAVLVSGPSHGSLTLNANGTFTYAPTANYNGTDSFAYRASDGSAQSAPTTVTISVTPVNDAPTALTDSYAATEDTQLVIAAPGVLGNDSDIDSASLTATVATGPAHGSVVVNADGSFTYTPDANYNGTDSFTYTASDGSLSSAPATVTITVASVNDNPVANGESLSTSEDAPLSTPILTLLSNDTDADGDTLTISSVGNATSGTVAISNGNVVFTPTGDFNGTAGYDYTVSDGHGGSSTAHVTVNVTAVNDAPVAAADTLNATEDTVVTFTAAQLLGNDNDVDNPNSGLSIASVTSGSGGTAVLNMDGSVTFTPGANYNGAATFTYTATDGQATSVPATVTVNVAAVNDAPVATADTLATNEDTALTFAASTLTGNDTDADGDALTVIGVSNATHGTVSLSGGQITFAPTADFHGVATFDYTVTDGNSGSSTATVTVNVASVNDAPVANPDALSATEDTPATFAATDLIGNDTDADGDMLTLVSVTSGTGGTVSLSGGVVSFAPDPNFNGPATFTYQVSDGTTTSTGTATVNVAAVNDNPVANADSFSTSEDTPLSVPASALTGNDTDVDGDTPAITGFSNATGGTVSLSGGNVVFTPTANFNGTAGYDYTISDGNGGASTAHVTVTVTAVNDNPVANADNYNTNEDTPVTVATSALLANDTDVDGDTLTVTSVGNATGGSVVLNGTNVTFTPGANFNGTAGYDYSVSDGHGGTSTNHVNVLVNPVNDAPVAVADSFNATEDTPVTFTAAQLLGNDTDVDNPNSALSIAGVTSGSGGTAVLNGNGTVTFTPGTNYNGTATFTYTATDGQATSAPATVSVNVAAVNDTATITGTSTGSVTEDGTLTTSGDVDVNDPDAGEAVFQTPPSLAGMYGTFTFNASTGVWGYTLNNANAQVQALNTGQTLTDTLTVRSADGTATQALTVTINGQDEPITGIVGTNNDDTLYGTGAADNIYGLDGNDALIGLGGADHLFGGNGSDTASYAGSASAVTVNLATGVATGGDAQGDSFDSVENLTGSSLNDTLTGNSGNNVLDGGVGNDTMAGGLGDDTYVVDATGDVVTEAANAGTDTVRTSLATYVLGANLENLTYTGSAAFTGTGNTLANVITGGAGADKLDGLAGADTMIGGDGNDTYTVDNTGDVVVEAAGSAAGTADLVNASVDYTLSANVENLTLTGTALNGTGNALDNVIKGTNGNNRIDGGAGADNMAGGLGDDTYVVDSASDIVVENASAGYDTIETTLNTLVLRTNVEKLVFVGTGAFTGTGNADDNMIVGGSGNDILDGRAGADTMVGGLGDDYYAIDNAGDVLTELAGQGTDTAYIQVANYTVGANVEIITLGSAGLNIVGNASANTIMGNSGNNRIDGGAGADTLSGYTGNDTFVFRLGEANGDRVTDFAGAGVAGGDVIELNGFGTLASGASIVRIGTTDSYLITADAAHGGVHETITLTGVFNLNNGDVMFV